MKRIDLTLLFVISFLALFSSCATGRFVSKPEKELKAEKIAVSFINEEVKYEIKVTNVSNKPLFLIVKSFTPFSDKGNTCENWQKKGTVNAIYTDYGISANYDESSNKDVWRKLEVEESYIFSGTLSPENCPFQTDKHKEKSYTREFILSLGYSQGIICKNPEDCEVFRSKKEFELSLKETMKLWVDFKGFTFSQFSFEIDEDEKQ